MCTSLSQRRGAPPVTVEIAGSRAARRRGLLGRDGIEGVLVLPRTRQVHTFGMRFAIDVIWCAADGTVVRTSTLEPNRLGAWVRRAETVLEAEAGWVDRWGVQPGDRLSWVAVGQDDRRGV